MGTRERVFHKGENSDDQVLAVASPGFGTGIGLLTTVPSPAAESTTATEKINKLIKQMGSNEFDDREEAQKQLDAIGEPAIDALKKAMSDEDTEIRRRAEDLIQKIETRTEGSKLLQPTKCIWSTGHPAARSAGGFPQAERL